MASSEAVTTPHLAAVADIESNEEPRGEPIGAPIAAPWVPDAVVESIAEALPRISRERSWSLGFTSAARGEGRTTLAVAAALALAGDLAARAVLLDLDLVHPRVHRVAS